VFLSEVNFWAKKVQANGIWREGHHMNIFCTEKKLQPKEKCRQFLWNSKNLDNCLQVVNSLSRLQMVYGGSYNERALSLFLHNFLILTPPPSPTRPGMRTTQMASRSADFFSWINEKCSFLQELETEAKARRKRKETQNIFIWLCWWKWDGWRGRGRWGGSLLCLCDSETSFLCEHTLIKRK
jgi:hypothetical protein